MRAKYDHIHALLASGQCREAEPLLAEALAAGECAELLYLKGQLAGKHGRWDEAIGCYLRAETLDPESPAREARLMTERILAFRHKDLYNP